MVPRPARAPVGRVTDGYRRFCLIAARMNNVHWRSHAPQSGEYPTLGQRVDCPGRLTATSSAFVDSEDETRPAFSPGSPARLRRVEHIVDEDTPLVVDDQKLQPPPCD